MARVRMDAAVDGANAAAREARLDAVDARRQLAATQEKLRHLKMAQLHGSQLETLVARRDDEILQLKEELAAYRRDTKAESVLAARRTAKRADAISQRLRGLVDSEAAERARLKSLVANQRTEIAELRQRISHLVQASRVVGDSKAAAAATDGNFRGRVQYEAVSAELDATAVDLSYVPHSPEERATMRSAAKARARVLLERAVELSSPDEARALQFRRPYTPKAAEKRNRRARQIRELLHSQSSSTAQSPTAATSRARSAAGAVSLPPGERRLSLLPGSVVGLGKTTADAFAEQATDTLPILDGWLAQSVAEKMEQTRALDKRLQILTHQLRLKQRDIDRLKKDRSVQDKVLEVFLGDRGVSDPEDVVQQVVAAVLEATATSSEQGLKQAAKSLARTLSSAGMRTPRSQSGMHSARSRKVSLLPASGFTPHASPVAGRRRVSTVGFAQAH